MLQETFERSERILSITSAKLEQLVLTLFIKATCINAPVVGMCHTKFGCIRRTFLLPSNLYATIRWHLLFKRVSHRNEGSLTFACHQWREARDLQLHLLLTSILL
jgi:hypothetical protein